MTDSREASTGMPSPGQGDHYDAASVPIRTASTVLILADRSGPEVLMLERNARSAFVGEMWVFPGGAVDPDDASPEADALVADLTDDEASRILGVPSGGIAYWVAALRETFEEAGVLLTHRGDGTAPLDLAAPDVAARFLTHRVWVNEHEGDFVDVVSSEDLQLDGSGVHYVARWVTPVGPPRRYDTRFFVTAMPPGQTPVADNDETVRHRWVRASEAIHAHVRGEMPMMTPTLAMLQRLATFESVEQAVRAAAGAAVDGSCDEVIRIRYGVEGPDRIAFPADVDYADASRDTERGVIRWPRA